MTILAFYLYEITLGRLHQRAQNLYWSLRDHVSEARGFYDWLAGND